ncbi:hypothetical protein JOF29_005604 [Kribbella aluminosa]|uniref:Uncharacterized protein n=1 Tax=Kribbella aluminosa TaxID=416017 RepID=A0ABS4US76_9ACTN|nr:hypothetical protein [Kribbella aluminosa]MBP2354494.1 hypothetical protein [Kribbella aluminosa]
MPEIVEVHLVQFSRLPDRVRRRVVWLDRRTDLSREHGSRIDPLRAGQQLFRRLLVLGARQRLKAYLDQCIERRRPGFVDQEPSLFLGRSAIGAVLRN